MSLEFFLVSKLTILCQRSFILEISLEWHYTNSCYPGWKWQRMCSIKWSFKLRISAVRRKGVRKNSDLNLQLNYSITISSNIFHQCSWHFEEKGESCFLEISYCQIISFYVSFQLAFILEDLASLPAWIKYFIKPIKTKTN